MLRARIIPTILIQNGGLVKTVNFKNPKYIGDPVNTVKIFNEKEVDELSVYDIDATVKGVEPDYELLKKLASQSRMPICYGGGIKTPDQAERIFNLGIEKIALSSVAFSQPEIAEEIADRVGSQSTVLVLDVKKKLLGGYEIFTHNGRKSTGKNPSEWIRKARSLKFGEVVINSIDNDGKMSGYDLGLLEKAREQTSLPITVLGGAGTYEDLQTLVQKYQIIGAAAGSLFVFKGKYKAVLITYPNTEEKNKILNRYGD